MAATDLDPLLDRIHREVAPLGVAARLKAHRLWQGWPAQTAEDLEARADGLAAALGRDRDEVERIRAAIARYEPTQRAAADGIEGPLAKSSESSKSSLGWVFAALLAVGVVIGFVISEPSQMPSDESSADASVMASTDAGMPDAATSRAATLEPVPNPRAQHVPVAQAPAVFDLGDWLAWLFGAALIAMGAVLLDRYRNRRALEIEQREAVARAAEADRRRLAAEKRAHTTRRAPTEWRAPPAGADASAYVLGQIFQARPGQRIDAEATAEATARAAGQLRVVPQVRRIDQPLTIFVDQGSGEHVWLGGFNRLVRFWRERHVPLRAFEFSRRPDWLTDEDGRRHTLAQVARRFGDGPLLILSHRLLTDAREGEARWTELLRAWPDRVWVDPDPRPPARRGATEARYAHLIESDGLARCPMTPEGLVAAARRLGGDPPGRAPRWPGLPDEDTPGYRAALAEWAAACALVPEAEWDGAESLREALPAVKAVFTERWHVQAVIDAFEGMRAARGERGPGLAERSRLVPAEEDLLASWAALDGIGDLAAIDARIAKAQAASLAARQGGPRAPGEAEADRLRQAMYDLRRAPSAGAVARVDAFLGTALAADARQMLEGFDRVRRATIDGATALHLDHALGRGAPGEVVSAGGFDRGSVRAPLAWAVVAAAVLWLGLWLLDGVWGGAQVPQAAGDDLWTLEVGQARPLTAEAAAVAAPTSILRLPDAGPPDGGPVDGGAPAPLVDAEPAVDAALDAGAEAARVLAATDNRPAMLPVRPGRFMMGSPLDEEGRFDNEGQHAVTLTRGFWLAETEVTEAQWTALMKSRPSRDGADYPVDSVNWFEAVAYVNALSKAEGLEPCYRVLNCVGELGSGNCDIGRQDGWFTCTNADNFRCGAVTFAGLDCAGYRLPTEAEWEYAARAGTTGARYGALADIAVYDGSGGAQAPVKGERQPNDWGLYDIIGNVYEWVQDAYENDITDRSEATPVEAPLPRDRVSRGCGWNSTAGFCRAANRYAVRPAYRNRSLGLRPARTWPLVP